MQQVFDAVNNLLERNGDRLSASEDLRHRPSAPGGSDRMGRARLPFGCLVLQRPGRDGRFPEDLKHMQCRKRLEAVKDTSDTAFDATETCEYYPS